MVTIERKTPEFWTWTSDLELSTTSCWYFLTLMYVYVHEKRIAEHLFFKFIDRLLIDIKITILVLVSF